MLDPRFTYLLLTIPFLAFVAVIFIKRPDLHRFIVKAGILGAITAVVSEVWYFQDYWRPLNIFGGIAIPSIEDLLFGFGVVALGATAPLFILRLKKSSHGSHGRRNALVAALIIVATLIVFVSLLHINSMVVSYVIFLVIVGLGLQRYPHLLKPALLSGLVLVLLASATYATLFLLDPTYIGKHFLLSGNPLAPTLFGFMPLTELIWYFSWGMAATVLHDLLNGKKAALTTSKRTA